MVWDMKRSDDIKLLLMEEQTLLSRERTMHSYMQTGLAFTSVGLVIMKFLNGLLYFCAGVVFIVLGLLLIAESGRRYVHFRKVVRKLREKETKLGYEIGIVQ
jgi:sulfite exporter TauE/SafE